MVLSGDDFTVLPTMAIGGCGVISVVSNIVPGLMADMCTAFQKGDLAKARELHYKSQPLCRAMFLETNPIPVKTSLAMMGRMGGELRLPMVPLEPKNEECLRSALKAGGLL